MKGKVLAILAVVLASICTVVLLFLHAKTNTVYIGSFDRQLKPNIVSKSNALELKYNSHYIVGITNNHIYLGHSRMPTNLIKVSTDLTDTSHLALKTKDWDLLRASFINLDSPYIYLTDAHEHNILRGQLSELTASQYWKSTSTLFDALPVSGGGLVLRTATLDLQEAILAKALIDPDSIHRVPGLLEKQQDGFFSTDGMLRYGKKMNLLVYLYFYRNQFMCMDTSLNLLYRANTIDTISRARITPMEFKTDRGSSKKIGLPPKIINKNSAVSRQWLFVHSGLLAKNEDPRQFEQSTVIDVYDLAVKGAYSRSFYIPDYKGHAVNRFKVYENLLVAIHDKFLVTYVLDTHQFNKISIHTKAREISQLKELMN